MTPEEIERSLLTCSTSRYGGGILSLADAMYLRCLGVKWDGSFRLADTRYLTPELVKGMK